VRAGVRRVGAATRRVARRLAAPGIIVAVLGGCALALASCGIPTQSAAQPAGGQAVSRLLPPPTTTTTVPKTAAGTIVSVYFVKSGKLVRRTRGVPPHDKILPSAIGSLLSGPNTQEIATGIDSALGYGSIKLASPIQRTKGAVVLDLSPSFGSTLSGYTEVLGVAQIVYTVAADTDPGIGVQFQLGGVAIEVPVESGALSTGAVHASQYASLVTPTSSATSNSTTGGPPGA
jgi:spore germination protein GerM